MRDLSWGLRWKVEHLSGLMTAAYWVDMMVVRRVQHSALLTADSKAGYWVDSKVVMRAG